MDWEVEDLDGRRECDFFFPVECETEGQITRT